MSDVLAPEAPQEITYPYGRELPAPGETIEVAPGVHWLRMPLPYHLDHINLYLIEDGEGFAVVDTGVHTSKVRELWERHFEGVMGGRPVTRVIVTHLHPDHVGNAGWICRKFGVPLYMTRTDYLMCRNLVLDTGTEAPEEATRFYREAGFNESQLDRYVRRFGGFGQHISDLPQSFRRIVDGEKLEVGGNSWQVVIGRGHAPEHACLWCEELGVILAGDQIIPRISSNISVHPTEPWADPLAEWLESCARLRDRIPAGTLVCPAHNEPFYGLAVRMQALIDDHEDGLRKLLTMLDEPRRSVDVFPALFKREITDDLVHMATGESLAHLNCLIGRGQAVRRVAPDGVARYVRTDRSHMLDGLAAE